MRYNSDCEEICSVEVASLVAWILAINLADWPQQSLRELKPAMVTDLGWHGFGVESEPAVDYVMGKLRGHSAYQRMLSAVMPGHFIEPHVDRQASYWMTRVHIPLTTNDRSSFVVGGVRHHLEVGKAYGVNTEALHSVTNEGETPRVHLMWDVRI